MIQGRALLASLGRSGPSSPHSKELLVRPAGRARINRLHRWRRFRRKFHWRLDLIHYLRYRPLQLRIVSINYRLRIVINFDVRIYAIAFDDPLAVLARSEE